MILDHKLMTLHHQLKPVPTSLERSQLLHALPCHSAQQLVLVFCLDKDLLHLKLLLGQLAMHLVHLPHLVHCLGTNRERVFGCD